MPRRGHAPNVGRPGGHREWRPGRLPPGRVGSPYPSPAGKRLWTARPPPPASETPFCSAWKWASVLFPPTRQYQGDGAAALPSHSLVKGRPRGFQRGQSRPVRSGFFPRSAEPAPGSPPALGGQRSLCGRPVPPFLSLPSRVAEPRRVLKDQPGEKEDEAPPKWRTPQKKGGHDNIRAKDTSRCC